MTYAEQPRRIRDLIEEYAADIGSLSRTYSITYSARTITRFEAFTRDWLDRVESIDFSTLDYVGRADYVLFSRHLRHALRQLQLSTGVREELLKFAPFAEELFLLEEKRKRMEPLDARVAAQTIHDITESLQEVERRLALNPPDADVAVAIVSIDSLRRLLKDWSDFYEGYSPEFNWWVSRPLSALRDALDGFEKFLREKVAGFESGETEGIVGRPVGREALIEALDHEMIPYSPEELISIGEREYSWCEERLKVSSNELGYGDDWLQALQHAKADHVAPGEQTELVVQLAREAVDYVESHHLVSVPPLAKETWRMAMMSPEMQKVNPFFLGGETIIVSYPTDSMSHQEKLMSMRGNASPLSRATVQHELIPGHHLQMFMCKRYKPYRRLFSTPFWIEGWTINWEMVLWDMGFPQTPEQRIGMLFWRIHRAARIVFSIKFHLGQMTAQECVDMLVERVGHERANAEGEVRRSFKGTYPPLYQAAYMIGGIMFRSMRRELVDSGQMTLKQFHDAVMQENDIPPVILRSILRGDEFTRDFQPNWRFDEP